MSRTRRDFLNTVALGAGAIALSCRTTRHAARQRGPNIIYILADDLGYGDLGCYGQKKVKTPNLDRFAAEGMRFTDHYSGSTVCAPSRNCLMTGEHTGHTWLRGNQRHPLREEDVTVAELLKGAGYTTGCVGKWGLGMNGTTGAPNRQGFDLFFGFLNQSRAHFYYPPYVWRNEKKVRLEGNDVKRQTGQYVHDLFTDEAIQFVRDNRTGPFFLYLPYTIPHAELTVPEDSMAQYKGKFPEEPWPKDHYGGQDTPHAAFAGMVSRLDRDVGRIMALLRETGLDENTIVMFSSDNGPHGEGGADPDFFESNGPLLGIKRDLYEGGVRVPMIARWPGRISPGSITNHVSAFWDVLPTCAELAGLSAPEGIDGISFVPTLRGRSRQRRHNHLYWEFYEQGGKQAVRKGEWKAVRLNVKRNPDGPLELYNLARDIGETTNVADKHPGIVAEMAAIMKRAHTDSEHYKLTTTG
jgi:arylsulfatase A-like enzyme